MDNWFTAAAVAMILLTAAVAIVAILLSAATAGFFALLNAHRSSGAVPEEHSEGSDE